MAELRDIYDRNKQLTGKVRDRMESLAEDEYFLVAYVCIINSRQQMLIQKRQTDKQSCPDMWDFSVGGCALTGETSREAAQRELYEELGYRYDFSGKELDFWIPHKNAFFDIYLLHEDINEEQLVIQESELQEIRWASRQEILDMIRRGEFVPYDEETVSRCFQ